MTGRCDSRLPRPTTSPPALNGRLLRLSRLQRARSFDLASQVDGQRVPGRRGRRNAQTESFPGSLEA